MKEILKYPNPILRKRSEEIKEINDEIKKLAQDMLDTHKIAKGVGLAAPQVGVLKRMIVAQLKDGPKVFINPEITSKTKESEVVEEGCLCLPGRYFKIKRAKGLEVKAQDLAGDELKLKAEGLAARVFQHEIDHLNGILIIDRMGFLQKIKRLWR